MLYSLLLTFERALELNLVLVIDYDKPPPPPQALRLLPKCQWEWYPAAMVLTTDSSSDKRLGAVAAHSHSKWQIGKQTSACLIHGQGQ